MVLVQGGPEHLGDLVRHLVATVPETDVLVRADAMVSLEPASTVVLCLRAEDFDWLNVARPIVRGHRVVLFGDQATAIALAKRSFDFHDWISHRLEAPLGPPAFALRALRRAGCARTPAIVWQGGDLDAAFAEAWPGRSLVRVSAAQPYPALVKAMRPKPRTWVAVTDLDETFRVQRARWAAAEAGRYGRTIFVEPVEEVDGAPVAHAMAMAIEEAASKLHDAGVVRPARTAVLLDLEPQAIERAAAMAKAGVSDGEISAELSGLAMAAMPARDLSARRLPDWPERVDLVLRGWDEEVARHWATSWRAAAPTNARATAAGARVLMSQGDFTGARALLEEAKRLEPGAATDEALFEIRRVEGFVLAEEGDDVKSLRAFDDAIKLLHRTRTSLVDADELYIARIKALLRLGRLHEAERTFKSWSSMERPAGSDDKALDYALGVLKVERGESDEAIKILRKSLDHHPRRKHRSRDALVQTLVQALIDRGSFADAERFARDAIETAKNSGRRTDYLRHEHARSLFGLGRFAEAEREFQRLIAGNPVGFPAGVARLELSRCLSSQGRLDEAEATIETAISLLQREGTKAAAALLGALYEKAHIQHLRGDHEQALLLLGEILAREERVHGRDHPTLVPTLTALGDNFIQLDQPAAAEPFFRRAQRLADRARDGVGLTAALGGLAVAQAMRRFRQAADTARRALGAWSHAGQPPTSALRETLETIAAGGLAAPGASPSAHHPTKSRSPAR